ncbi:MAG: hypothetical protein LLG14_23190 [Nocardiaceae bacterium]|nr:hypothetical protein [Nocardiaceae bacterium]
MRRRIRRRGYGIGERAVTLALGTVGALVVTIAAVLPSGVPSETKAVEVGSLAGLSGTTPESPIRFTADTALFEGVDLVKTAAATRGFDGEQSPDDTIYLKMNRLIADNLTIASTINGQKVTVRNDNRGDPNLAAMAGGPGSAVEAWAVVNGMDVCVTQKDLEKSADALGVHAAQAKHLIGTAYAPYRNVPVGRDGQCVPLGDVAPALSYLTERGGVLPPKIRTENLDLTVFQLTVDKAPGLSSLTAPTAVIGLE